MPVSDSHAIGTTGKQLVRYSEIVKERCEADTKIVEFAGGGSMGIRCVIHPGGDIPDRPA